MKNRFRGKYVIIAGVILLAVCWGIAFIHVNSKYKMEKDIVCKQGETYNIFGCDFKIAGAEWMDEEGMKSYHVMPLENLGEGRMLVVTMELDNNTEQTTEVPLYQAMMEYEYYTNAVSLEAFMELNERGSLHPNLEAGEHMELKLPFVVYEKQFSKKKWKNIEEDSGNIIMALYPQKIMMEY